MCYLAVSISTQLLHTHLVPGHRILTLYYQIWKQRKWTPPLYSSSVEFIVKQQNFRIYVIVIVTQLGAKLEADM